MDIGSFLKLGLPFGGPNNKDNSISGSLLGFPYFGKLPFWMEAYVSSKFRVSGLAV